MDETSQHLKTVAARKRVVSTIALLNGIWAIFGVALVLLIGLEESLTVYYDRADKKELQDAAESAVNSGVYANSSWAREYVRELFEYDAAVWRTWEPYTYRGVPEYQGKYINVAKDGSRRTWNSDKSNDSGIANQKVFFFGGSTLFGYGSRDDFTIPSLVSKKLAESGVSVTVTNYAVDADASTPSMIRFVSKLRERNVPNLVVFYGGLVDAIAACLDGKPGVPLGSSYFEKAFSVKEVTARIKPENLALMRLVTGRQKLSGCSKELGGLSDGAVSVYLENVRFIQEISKVFSFKTLFYLEPQLSDKIHRTRYEESKFLESKTALPGLNELYSLTRSKLAQRESGVLGEAVVDDLRGIFSDVAGPIYVDDGHYGEDGNERISREIAADILALYPPAK